MSHCGIFANSMTFIVFVKMNFLELVVDLFSIYIDFFSGNDETSKTMQKDEEAVALLRGEDAKNALITDEVETVLKDIFTCEGNLATFCELQFTRGLGLLD